MCVLLFCNMKLVFNIIVDKHNFDAVHGMDEEVLVYINARYVFIWSACGFLGDFRMLMGYLWFWLDESFANWPLRCYNGWLDRMLMP